MPRLCPFGCPPSDITMHCFPNPDKYPERFRAWVYATGGKLESTSDYEYYKKKRICDIHFKHQDRNRYNRLNSLAVPSLYLSGISNKLSTTFEETIPCQAGQPSNIAESVISQNVLNATEKTTSSVLQGISKKLSTTFEETIPCQAGQPSNIAESVISQNVLNATEKTTSSVLQGISKKLSTTFEETIPCQAGQPSNIAESVISQNVLNATEKTTSSVLQGGTPDARVLAEHNYTAASKIKLQKTERRSHQNPRFNCVQLKIMRSQIKNLQSEICRLKRDGDFSGRLANATKLSEKNGFQRVVARMPKPTQLFINMQIQGKKKPKGRRFTIEEKVLCLSLFKKSPKCYTLLHKYFTLPSSKAMKRLLSQIKLCPGINPIIFEKIKSTVSEMGTADKLFSLAFDEMSITAQISYDQNKDTLEGFAWNAENKFANHALVFMIKGIKQNFKQPLAYYFTNSLNTLELKKLIKTVISHAQDAGLVIINTVCDQSTVNVSAINSLVLDTRALFLRRGKDWRHDCFTVKGRQIIPIYDTPHLIKGIRNNLLDKDMLYTMGKTEKIVKWDYFQKVYYADKALLNLKLLHKVTEEHINPEKINKMRVKTATQIFSHSFAVITDHLVGRKYVPNECRDLVDITLLLDDLFDSLNVSSMDECPDGKEFKGAVRRNSPHHRLWCESKKVLKTVRYLKKTVTGGKSRLTECVVPSVTNLIKTIEGMEAIWKVLSTQYGLDAMLTRNFNQDPVENFFGNVRSYGARNNAPDTVAFEGAFKALLLNNYNTTHSKLANCEADKSDCLQNLDFFLKESCVVPEATDDSQEHIPCNQEIFEVDIQPQEDMGQRNYVCGWVVKKCLTKICKSCQQCRLALLDKNEESNKYIRLREYKNKNWLCYPSKDTTNCFHDIQKITSSVLKRNVPKKNLKRFIIQLCNVLIDYPFVCSAHQEALQSLFLNLTITVLLHSWCRTVNRILSGKITYEGDDEIKTNASIYFNKYKHYKNKK